MSIIINNIKPIRIMFNDVEATLYHNGIKIWPEGLPIIPANTIRVRTNDGQPPVKSANTSYETATLVPGTTDVYDVYRSGISFNKVLSDSTNVVEILGVNPGNVTNMSRMFYGCTSLTTVPLFDTSSVTNMSYMFEKCTSLTSVPLFNTSSVTNMLDMFTSCTSLTTVPLFDTSSVTNMFYMFTSCTSLTTVPLFDTSSVTNMTYMFFNCKRLTTIPLFDTSSVTDMSYMFEGCTNVQSGALALYQQASTQSTPPSSHTRAFRNCGRDTTTGAAELAQIPDDWK